MKLNIIPKEFECFQTTDKVVSNSMVKKGAFKNAGNFQQSYDNEVSRSHYQVCFSER